MTTKDERRQAVLGCLWVRDAERRGQDPEPVRCRPGGYVNCRPCLDRFDAEVKR